MPHITIKHFPIELTDARAADLIDKLTKAVETAFRVDESVISIALEPVAPEAWNEQVYVPEIFNRRELLRKAPRY